MIGQQIRLEPKVTEPFGDPIGRVIADQHCVAAIRTKAKGGLRPGPTGCHRHALDREPAVQEVAEVVRVRDAEQDRAERAAVACCRGDGDEACDNARAEAQRRAMLSLVLSQELCLRTRTAMVFRTATSPVLEASMW